MPFLTPQHILIQTMKYFYTAVLCLSCLALGSCKNQQSTNKENVTDSTAVSQVRFNADSAYTSIIRQCDFGPRVPNSPAHEQCGDYIVQCMKATGLQVTEQRVSQKAWDGQTLKTRNIIGAYHPDAAKRIVLAAHWDSRPWCDADPDSSRHREPVMAANDGASGVAVMLEVARLLPELDLPFGVDFVCFDSEDYGAPYWASDQAPEDGSDWCMGSQYWSAHPHVSGYRAEYGILLDMVGGKDARFCFEGFSLKYAQRYVMRLWDAAQRVGADRLFVPKEGGYATDDHVPMNEIAGIPTVDVIPFVEGPHSFGRTWHTVNDTPENISKETLQGVGQTLIQMLADEKEM